MNDEDEALDAFLRFLRPECTACGSTSLSWCLADDFLAEVNPPFVGEDLESFQKMLSFVGPDAFAWQCNACTEFSVVDHGTFG